MLKKTKDVKAGVNVYHGYGHTDDLLIYGHVLKGRSFTQKIYTDNLVINVFNLIRLFFIVPLPSVKVKLHWNDQIFYTTTASDGFFKLEWKSDREVAAGWHDVNVDLLNGEDQSIATGVGKIFVPHRTQFGFISDIDDTVLVSHSGKTGKKLWSMLTKNPRSRKTFDDAVHFYQLLSAAHTESGLPNPFFYVSSSEWNLYHYLNEFFKYNQLPKGVFLLNHIKKWYQLFTTGNTKHMGKFDRIQRVLKLFPNQQFVLLGDNSQQDPEIYKLIADEYPTQIHAVYIRNIAKGKEIITAEILGSLQNKTVATLQYQHTKEAIEHAGSIGLINQGIDEV